MHVYAAGLCIWLCWFVYVCMYVYVYIDLFGFNSHLVQSRLKINVMPIISRLYPLVGKIYHCPIAVTQIRTDLRRQQSSAIAKNLLPSIELP